MQAKAISYRKIKRAFYKTNRREEHYGKEADG
jgi:hypothetical protein